MLHGQRIAVVVPAFDEAEHIEACLRDLPPYVDAIVVVDDASRDDTAARARAALDARAPRVRSRLVRHAVNRGVGGAILTGYVEAAELGADIAVVMAGDGQMDPDDMPALLLPVLSGEADYVKGDRLAWPGGVGAMPRHRLVGIRVLETLTRVSTGLYDLHDFQCGYTALRLSLLPHLDLERVYPRYGFPNDFLNHLVLAGARVAERPVRPIYEGQRSDLRPGRVALPILWLLAKGTGRRCRRLVEARLRGDAPPLPAPAAPVAPLAPRRAQGE